jgi:hypothetical protein
MMIRKATEEHSLLLTMREKAANDRMKSWIDVALSAPRQP